LRRKKKFSIKGWGGLETKIWISSIVVLRFCAPTARIRLKWCEKRERAGRRWVAEDAGLLRCCVYRKSCEREGKNVERAREKRRATNDAERGWQEGGRGERGGRRRRRWGQWRCPSEGHGRECGLRPSVQSGVPRCRLSSLALAPFAFLPSRMPPPPFPSCRVHPFVRPSVSLSLSFSLCVCVSLSLFFSLRAPRHGADCRNAPNAPRWPIPVPVLPLPLVYFGRLPLPVPSPCLSFVVLRFFFLRSATPPPRAALASFTSFCRRRCHSRVRTASLAPMRWRASSPPRPPHGMYVRMVKHARTRVRTGGTQKRHVVSLPEIHTGSSIATRSHYNVRSLAPSRRARFLFLSSLPKVRAFLVGLLRRVLRSRFLLRPGMTLAHGNADPAVSVVDRRRWRD